MSQTLWGKQTSRNFKDIIMECAENTDGIDPHEEGLFLFNADNPAAVERFYRNMPYSIQKVMHMYTLGRADLTFPINIKFDRECLDRDAGILNFHSKLSDTEMKAVKQSLKEICDMVDAEFMGMTSKDEYLIQNTDFDNLSRFLIAIVSTRLGGVRMKYIAPYEDQEDTYRLYFERNSDDDPLYSRYLFVSESSSFECPNCGKSEMTSVNDDKKDFKTFCCLSCGIAANIEYMALRYDFEPDVPSERIKRECEKLLKKAYTEKDSIEVRSDLELIGKTESIKLYEDTGVYPYSEHTTELWIQKESSPVIMYDIETQEFLDNHHPNSDSLCEVCNENENTTRISGAYYAQGVGIHEKEISVCEDCQNELLDQIRKILQKSNKSTEYIGKIL